MRNTAAYFISKSQFGLIGECFLLATESVVQRMIREQSLFLIQRADTADHYRIINPHLVRSKLLYLFDILCRRQNNKIAAKLAFRLGKFMTLS